MAATGTCMDSTSSSFNTIIPLLVLLMTTIFSAEPRVAGEPPSVVPLACKDAAAGGTFTEDFCLSVLQGKNSAGAADFADLALVAVDLATANATATAAKIDAAGNNNGGDATSQGLQSCRALYGAVVRQYQPQCREAVKGRRFGNGKTCLGRTAQAAAACERWFQQRKVASPVI